MRSVPPSFSAPPPPVGDPPGGVSSEPPHAAPTRARTVTTTIALSARFKATPLLEFPFGTSRTFEPSRLVVLLSHRGFPLSIRSDGLPRIEGVTQAVPDQVEGQGREEQGEPREDHQPGRE